MVTKVPACPLLVIAICKILIFILHKITKSEIFIAEMFLFLKITAKIYFYSARYKLILISPKLDDYIKVHRGSWGHI